MVFLPIAVVTILAAMLTVVGAFVVDGHRPVIVIAIAVTVVAVSLVLAPLAVEALVARLLNIRYVWFYDLRLPFLLTTITIPVLLAWFFVRRGTAGARVIVGLWAWAGFAGVLNTVNKCAPGWCGSYGFPVPFYAWSDAVMSFNGETPQPFMPGALLFDVLVVITPFLAVSLRVATERSRTSLTK